MSRKQRVYKALKAKVEEQRGGTNSGYGHGWDRLCHLSNSLPPSCLQNSAAPPSPYRPCPHPSERLVYSDLAAPMRKEITRGRTWPGHPQLKIWLTVWETYCESEGSSAKNGEVRSLQENNWCQQQYETKRLGRSSGPPATFCT